MSVFWCVTFSIFHLLASDKCVGIYEFESDRSTVNTFSWHLTCCAVYILPYENWICVKLKMCACLLISIFHFVIYRENEICKFMSQIYPFAYWFKTEQEVERIRLSFISMIPKSELKSIFNHKIRTVQESRSYRHFHYHDHFSNEMRWDGCIAGWLNLKFEMKSRSMSWKNGIS